MGIDFQGGTLIEIKTKESPANLSDIRGKVSGLGLGEVQIQEFGAPDAVLIRIASQPTEQEQQASIAKVKDALGDDGRVSPRRDRRPDHFRRVDRQAAPSPWSWP